ncbi:hypothetical protein [Microbacterium sp.]|uniref:hypothetical protein n=1 Tax=Microbacterium sp. TaxID=51671 RepID=UPI0025FDBEA6|nr:hypothetical protein [Microbacterium sp.]
MTVRARRSAAPAALRVAIVYVIARLITTAFLLIAAALSGPESRFGADATLGSLSMGWDGQWYWLVGTTGYPARLPLDDAGAVAQNAWAFMPLYPALSRGLSVVLGSYPIAAVLLALVAGYVSTLVLFHLLRERIDATSALWAVALFTAGPMGALFQMGYAETLFLTWLFLALWALVRRRFGWLYLLIPLLGYTRPGVLAFALLLGLYGLHRWWRRRVDPLPPAHMVHIFALGALATAVGFSWQLIAGAVTGDPSAYLDTELSWRQSWTGEDESGFVPFSGFIEAAVIWFRLWGLPEVLGYVALALVVAAATAVLMFSRHVRRLGPEVRLWSASYLVYLLAVFFPQSSVFRLLLPLAPLYGALALPRSVAWRVTMLVLGLVAQAWWIYQMLALGNTYARIP